MTVKIIAIAALVLSQVLDWHSTLAFLRSGHGRETNQPQVPLDWSNSSRQWREMIRSVMNGANLNRIDPEAVYSPRELARAMGTGPQSIYRPIRQGRLRAAILNDRGDLRVLGAWALEYLNACSVSTNTATEAQTPA